MLAFNITWGIIVLICVSNIFGWFTLWVGDHKSYDFHWHILLGPVYYLNRHGKYPKKGKV